MIFRWLILYPLSVSFVLFSYVLLRSLRNNRKFKMHKVRLHFIQIIA